MLRSRAVALKQIMPPPPMMRVDVKVISSLLVYMTASVIRLSQVR